MIHSLHAELWLPKPVEEVFAFFSDAFNLEAITPPRIGFHVLTPAPIELKAGALIDYRIRINGIPMKWRTRIETWNPPHSFSDVQLKGPYRLWDHTHTFVSENRGTRMIDDVKYQLPFGPLGDLVNTVWVARDVASIFKYREKIIRQKFA